MTRVRELPVEARWEQFLARTAFACPRCGYDMHGLRGATASRCPECGRDIDIETAMYIGEPVRAGVLWRTTLGVWSLALANALMLLGAWALFPALELSKWTSRPPTGWYALLTARMAWLAVLSVSLAAWWLDLRIGGFGSEGGQGVFKAATRMAVVLTIMHAAWLAARLAGVVR